MTTHECFIDVDGLFRGTTNEVMNYLGFGNRSQITQCALKGRMYKGHKLTLVGYIRYQMLYELSKDGKKIRTGTSEELSKALKVEPCTISNYARTGRKLRGGFNVARIRIINVLEEV